MIKIRLNKDAYISNMQSLVIFKYSFKISSPSGAFEFFNFFYTSFYFVADKWSIKTFITYLRIRFIRIAASSPIKFIICITRVSVLKVIIKN